MSTSAHISEGPALTASASSVTRSSGMLTSIMTVVVVELPSKAAAVSEGDLYARVASAFGPTIAHPPTRTSEV